MYFHKFNYFLNVLKFLETFFIMKHIIKNVEKEGYSCFHIIIIFEKTQMFNIYENSQIGIKI